MMEVNAGTSRLQRATLAHALSWVIVVVGLSPVAYAQFTGDCEVIALNRTSFVAPDGSWVIADVLSGTTSRVHATCVTSGACF
jgi:hypothetical protein